MSEAVKDKVIEIIDRGRGPQLSTSRITVLDLVPYFQQGMTSAEIVRWLPTLSHDEIAVVERYYREHKAECDEEDRLATEHRDEQIRLQKLRFPDLEETSAERMARMKKRLAEIIRERNGAGNPG